MNILSRVAAPLLVASTLAGPALAGGETLIVGIPGDIRNTDPALVSDTNSYYVTSNVMQGLVGLKQGSLTEIKPLLASALPEISPDGLTYTFKIREGVKFHDGTPVDAQAVKYNYERWINFPKSLQGNSYWSNIVLGHGSKSAIAAVEAPDSSTFIVRLKKPNSSFLTTQTLPSFAIASPTALKQGKGDNSVETLADIPAAQGGVGAMVGTGPFKFSEWSRGSQVTVVKNTDYWDQAGAAKSDKIVFRKIADSSATLNALQAGDIDIAQVLSPLDVDTASKDANLKVVDRGKSCNMVQLDMNMTKPVVSNPTMRRAMMYAIDREAILKTVYGGRGEVADGFVPTSFQNYVALGLPTYNPAKAKELLDQSGLSAEQRQVDFYYPSDVSRPYMPDPKALFQAIAQNLEAVGIKVNAKTETWSPNYLDNEYAGLYQLWILGLTCNYAQPEDFLKVGLFGYIDGKPSVEFGYKNDDIQVWMDQALAATDPKTVADKWVAVQESLGNDLPIIPLVNSSPAAVMSAKVKGFVGSSNLQETLASVSVSE